MFADRTPAKRPGLEKLPEIWGIHCRPWWLEEEHSFDAEVKKRA